MKPVELFSKYIDNSSKPGQLVLDPFGGSGTTIVACEALGRKARAIELEPSFCDSIVQRFAAVYGSIDIKCIRNNQEVEHPFN
jgi:DNA modification methylase